MPSQPSPKKAGKYTQASYYTAKSICRCCTMLATMQSKSDHKSFDIFSLANQMRKENVDVVGDKPVKNDAGEMSIRECFG